MTLAPDNLRLVLGLKARALREKRGWTLQALSRRSGLAVSYLSEIEKGKKYPKAAKLLALAVALEVPFEELASPRLDGELSPLSSLAGSEFLRVFPFGHFGLAAGDLLDLLAADPRRTGALLRTFGEVARRFDVDVEHLLFAALRSHQQLHGNFFPEIEAAAERFRAEAGWRGRARLAERDLRGVLERRFGVRLELATLPGHRDLAGLRSLYAPGDPPVFHLNGRLLPTQRAFAMAREIGFRVLDVGERTLTGSWVRAESFEQVLGNFRASYFAGALMMPRTRLAAGLRSFFAAPRFRHAALETLLRRFGVTPEMLFYRITQVAPAEFGLGELFFARFIRDGREARPRLARLLNLSRVAVPFDVSPAEHSCRRWPGVAVLEPRRGPRSAARALPSDAAVCRFQGEPAAEFLVIAMARRLALTPSALSSVSLGLRVDDRLREVVRFAGDPELETREVDLSCERCPLPGEACRERLAPASILARREGRARRQRAIAALLDLNVRPPLAVRMPPP